MAGNALEWVSDVYGSDYYSNSEEKNPAGPVIGEIHLLRGGSWSHLQADLSVTRRFAYRPDYVSSSFGFRCVVNLPGSDP